MTLRNVGFQLGRQTFVSDALTYTRSQIYMLLVCFPGSLFSLFACGLGVVFCANEFFLFDNAERKRARSKWHRTTFAEWNRTVGPALVASPS